MFKLFIYKTCFNGTEKYISNFTDYVMQITNKSRDMRIDVTKFINNELVLKDKKAYFSINNNDFRDIPYEVIEIRK